MVVTDAWVPQVNGVVRTLRATGKELTALGHQVRFVTPENQTTVPLPTYPEIRLALYPRSGLCEDIESFAPHSIHIATEGTMGLSARRLCLERDLPFTTSFHTRFPEYIHARFPFISESLVFGALKTFHAPAAATMVATARLKTELELHGFSNLVLWSRGVDTERFRPGSRNEYAKLGARLQRPIFLYVGRVAIEKNVEAFLGLDLPGSKVVIGEGPQKQELEVRFPEALFLGARTGEELAAFYSSSDVFVFPSRTDTFGLVILEALASGLPVAAYPVPGPLDVVGDAPIAVLDEDLQAACLRAHQISSDEARTYALTRSWRASSEQFLANLALIE
jgi:glycosyltransferase involved in cell wall biosynthesis